MSEGLTQEQLELRQLQQQLTEAKQRQATLLQAAADKAALAVHEARRKAEAEEALKLAEHNQRVEELLAKRRAAEASEAQRRAAEKAETARLEREAEALQEQLRDRAKHEAELKTLQDRLFQEEQENIRIARELQGKAMGPKPEPVPTTLSKTPLAVVLRIGEVAANPEGLSAAENALLQAHLDAEAAKKLPPVRQRTHPSGQQVYDLQNLFKKHLYGCSPNYDALLEVLAFHADNIVAEKVMELIPWWKERPTSATAMVAQLRDALDNPAPSAQELFATAQAAPEPSEVITLEDELFKAQVARYSNMTTDAAQIVEASHASNE